MTDLVLARAAMAARLDGIGFPERVVTAMADVPRHAFVPPAFWRLAYAETDLWLGDSWLASPIATARALAALAPRAGERVLEFGTGRGYQTALLAALGAEVFTIEPLGGYDLADGKLPLSIHRSLGGDATAWRERAPFDAIVVNAPLNDVPPALINQLAPDHGRLVITLSTRLTVLRVGADGVVRSHEAGVVPPRAPEQAAPATLGTSLALEGGGTEP